MIESVSKLSAERLSEFGKELPVPSYQAIAGEVRAEMARQQLSGIKAAKLLGWTQNYISRRLSGTVPFDVADLQAIADLLEVPVTNFYLIMGADVRRPGSCPEAVAA